LDLQQFQHVVASLKKVIGLPNRPGRCEPKKYKGRSVKKKALQKTMPFEGLVVSDFQRMVKPS
jgi:hypothetical protein